MQDTIRSCISDFREGVSIMRREIMTASAFIIPLALLSVLSAVMPQKVFSEEENRYLAQKPVFTIESFKDGKFGNDYETWLSDQFPFRKTFVAAKTNADRLILREDVNDVYFGKDHYYIEKTDPENLLTPQLYENLDYLSDAAAQFNSMVGAEHVKIMLVPSASQILKDKLPPFAAPADQSEAARIARDKIREKTGEEGNFLDIEGTLLKAWEECRKIASEYQAGEEQLYYKTDHHWTTLGAWYAYRLYGWEAGFEPWGRDRFTEIVVSDNFQGTIQSKLGVALVPDTITLFIPGSPTSVNVYYDGLPKAYDTLYNKKALEKKDQYSVFLDGNHGLTKIVNNMAGVEAKGKRLLIIKDSYAHSFAPFVINHFEEVYMIDLRYFNMKPAEFAKSREITDILVLYQIPGFAKDGNLFKMVR